jgi:hypothetical protein
MDDQETVTLSREQWSEVRIALMMAAQSTRDPQRKATRLALYEQMVNQGAAQATDKHMAEWKERLAGTYAEHTKMSPL